MHAVIGSGLHPFPPPQVTFCVRRDHTVDPSPARGWWAVSVPGLPEGTALSTRGHVCVWTLAFTSLGQNGELNEKSTVRLSRKCQLALQSDRRIDSLPREHEGSLQTPFPEKETREQRCDLALASHKDSSSPYPLYSPDIFVEPPLCAGHPPRCFLSPVLICVNETQLPPPLGLPF